MGNRRYERHFFRLITLPVATRGFQTLFSGGFSENSFSVYLSIYGSKYLNQNENTGMFLFIIDTGGGKG